MAADGTSFRDLNGNGELDPYEDPRVPVEARVDDLLARMTLEEKAAQLFHQGLLVPDDGAVGEEPNGFSPVATRALVAELGLTHFNIYWTPGPVTLAEWHNRMQEAAEATRLGIPVTISSDPRHGLGDNPATSMAGAGFSKWPDPIGLAATRDAGLVREFADVVRQEYLAVGIRLALHPTADLATEPRWCRAAGTFGEDADVVASMVAAYLRGMQLETLGPESVACMTKHFPGGGPQLDGEDAHFPYGREQVYPGGNFDYHLIPFAAAIEAGTAQVMPYYGMPVGTEHEEVGFGFNHGVITGLLRERYGFDGVVCSDWGLLTDAVLDGVVWPARAWGVEHLSTEERALKVLAAGVDQFGGEACPEVVVELVRSGRIDEARIDASVRRLLRDKFRLGLFDDPYVDAGAAADVVGRAELHEARPHGTDALLRPAEERRRRAAPSGQPTRLCRGARRRRAARAPCGLPRRRTTPTSRWCASRPRTRPATATSSRLCSMRAVSPSTSADIASLLELMRRVPTVVDIYLDRAAVIPEIADGAAALLASFGATDDALLEIVLGRAAPTGALPFELPSSLESVRLQHPDLPYDSADPLFAFGHGLTYADD